MSKIGTEVSLKTPREIFEAAQEARRRLHIGPDGRLALLDMEYMLERLVKPIYGVDFDVLDEDDPKLAGAHAAYDVREQLIRVRHSVLLRSRAEDPQAIFTICHELGHVCLHSNPTFFRRTTRGASSRLRDAEWQADRFAAEFCIDRKLLHRYSEPASAAVYFRMPLGEMKLLFAQLREEGVLTAVPKTQMDRVYDVATQEDFDF